MNFVKLLVILCLATCVYPKTVVEKVVRPDTTIRKDTIVRYDTLVITKTYRDTAIYVKSDTVVITPKKKR